MSHQPRCTIKSFDGNNRERARAEYVLAYLTTGDKKKAEEASGFPACRHQRIVDMWRERASIRDKPMQQPARKLPPLVLQQAFQRLKTSSEIFNGPEYFSKLQEEGVIPQGCDKKWFFEKLKKHIASKGCTLQMSSTKSVFYLSEGDMQTRLKYCKGMLSQLIRDSLDHLMFADETTLEDAPHPKSR